MTEKWRCSHFTDRAVREKEYAPLPASLGYARVLFLIAVFALACVRVAYGRSCSPYLFGLLLGFSLFWCRLDDFNKSEIPMNRPLEGKEMEKRKRERYLFGEGVVVTALWVCEVVLASHFHLSLLQYALALLSLAAWLATKLHPTFLAWSVLLALSGSFA